LGVAEDGSGVLDLAFWREQGGAERWSLLHGQPGEADQIRLLRRCTYAGRPLGEEEFVEQMENKFHRSWRRWGFEAGGEQATGAAIR
jgi:putative transposase